MKHHQNKILLLITCLAIVLFNSCGMIYLRAIGVKPFKPVNEEQLISYLSSKKVSIENVYQIDSVSFVQLINTKKKDTLIYNKLHLWIQNHVQPLQTICFDNETQKPIYAYFNCIAESKGLTQFTWNKNKELESFPPKEYTSENCIDSLFTMTELTNTMVDFKGNLLRLQNNGKRYSVFLYYSLFVQKQANNIIKETITHLNKYAPNEYNLYFVNFDNCLYQLTKSN